MTPLPKFSILFADRGEMLRELGSSFRGEQARLSVWDVAIVLSAGALIVALFFVLSRFTSWREGRSAYQNSRHLFRRLSSAHGLTIRERWLITQAARYVSAPLPACLFLRPDLFDLAAAHPEFADRAAELTELKGKLFDL
jgi:hypothetical protein